MVYRRLKIDFVDFWPGFDKYDNIFYNTLKRCYEIDINPKPDVLIYSCNGVEHLKYRCKKIFYSCENVRPDFSLCDFAITFDHLTQPNHFRLPLFALYHDLKSLNGEYSREFFANEWHRKKKFCCIVVSNSAAKDRIDFFYKLSKYKAIDSGGRWNNTIGYYVSDKLDFIKDYKFVFAFENSSYPGYTTEKILEPLLKHCIPIYWGNPKVNKDFNEERIINFHSFRSAEEVIDYIIKLDQDDQLAIDLLSKPIFNPGDLPAYCNPDNLFAFLEHAIHSKIIPVSLTSHGKVQAFKAIKWRQGKEFIKRCIPKRMVSFIVHKKRTIKLRLQNIVFNIKHWSSN